VLAAAVAGLGALVLLFVLLEDASPSEQPRLPRGEVTRVVDGDTIDVRVGGLVPVAQRVRLIGINTPEVGRSEECWGPKAAADAARILKSSKLKDTSFKTLEKLIDGSDLLKKNWRRDGNSVVRW
jgi:endonuclease YncB( thermonuclease family)